MQKEKISIQLYKGFAVVKGEYWMYNESNEEIVMQSDYLLMLLMKLKKKATN
ncbi:MAG: hypothetical protein ACI94Y_003257 [Maribacter sp.]|jgi:hypothetical protein